MKKLYTYGLLTLILALPIAAISQEREKVKSLKELRQLERGFVEVDEIEPLIYEVPDVPDVVYIHYGGKTKINLRKDLDLVSMSHKYTFNVDEDYSNIEFLIRGELFEGSFSIKLTKPDKTVMREITITPEKEYEWHQPYTLDKVKKGGIGTWTVELAANNASGYFQFYCSSR